MVKTHSPSEIIVEIRFGEGGADSKLFVHDLASAYTRYAQTLKLKTELLLSEEGHVILQVKGDKVADYFLAEAGKHCCQRVPPTESKGRVHTSMISVSVLPLPPIRKEDEIPEKDLTITTQRGHGKGGQHQNKTDSAVRIVHNPTKMMVFINGRDQHANKREAIRIISARVRQHYNDIEEAKYNALKKSQAKSNRGGEKVRTYNFAKCFVKDHVLDTKTSQIQQIMKGRFDLLKK